MTRLTDEQYWEELYQGEAGQALVKQQESRQKRVFKRVLGKRLLDLLSPYDYYLLWLVVFPSYLPPSCNGKTVVEIGSAPGDFLVRFSETFGAIAYGIEYTRRGAERNRAYFAANGLDPANVIEADVFSPELLKTHGEYFDIVISRGFIEHFADAKSVVARHVALLRPGGLLFILIPNLRGVYGPWTKLFNPDQIPLHNLEIMQLSRFRQLFEDQPLEILRCSYFGTFSFWLFTAPNDARWIGGVIRLLITLQRGLNLIFRVAFSSRGCESSVFSPNLIFVGRKRMP